MMIAQQLLAHRKCKGGPWDVGWGWGAVSLPYVVPAESLEAFPVLVLNHVQAICLWHAIRVDHSTDYLHFEFKSSILVLS